MNAGRAVTRCEARLDGDVFGARRSGSRRLRAARAERVTLVKRRSLDAPGSGQTIDASQPLRDMNAAASATAMAS
jgi:hypothetical protein